MTNDPDRPHDGGSRKESMFEELKRYVRFTAEDSAHLAAFEAFAAPHFPAVVDLFYERVREHEDAHAVLQDEAQLARLKATLVLWLRTLCSGPHDETYFENRARIGRAHVRIGLPQRYMPVAMSVVRVELQAIAATLPEPQRDHVRAALARILDIDLAIMLETYRDDFVERLQRIERLERDRVERALARSEHRYVSAIELAKVLIVGLDPDGRIGLFNREAERVTGLARDEVLGRDLVEAVVPEEARAEFADRIRHITGDQDATDQVWEAPLVTRAGKRRTVRWQITYAPDGGDEDIVLFAVGQDVTDSNALLERTLRNEKLAAVGTLAAGLAHEIRNPLNGALLHVTFLERALQRTPVGSEAHSALMIIGDEIRRLSALVKDFLVFARPSPPQLKAIGLHGLCERAAGVVAKDAAAAKVAVQTDLGAVDHVLEVDPQKIEQALLNLLQNAVQAAGSNGGGTVTLRARRLPREVHVEVEDDGPGLPSPEAPIFDAFFTTKPQGTGLGLAIVQRIASDHGGTVEVDSRPGKTIFRLALPLRPAA
jgi:PAS domain S-box-containing protein